MLNQLRKFITIVLVGLTVFTVNISAGQNQSRVIYALPLSYQLDETVDQHGSDAIVRISQYQAQKRLSEKRLVFTQAVPDENYAVSRHKPTGAIIGPEHNFHYSSRAPPFQLA